MTRFKGKTLKIASFLLLATFTITPRLLTQQTATKEKVSSPMPQQQASLEFTKLFFIRHAEVNMGGDMKDPALSEEGQKRATAWASFFEKEEIDAIYSTNLTRTKSTAQPLANKVGKNITFYHPHELELEKFLADVKGKTIVVVGHSNTNPLFVNALLGEERYGQMEADNFASVYVVHYHKKGHASASELMFN